MRRTSPTAALVVASALVAAPAAGSDGLEITVDCRALDGDARAALEARARADLAVRGVLAGAVHVGCGLVAATVTLDARGRRSTRKIALARPPSALVEAALGALYELVGESEQATPPSPPPPALRREPPGPDSSRPAPPRAGSSFGVIAGIRGESWSRSFAIGPRGAAFVTLGRVDVGLELGASFALGSNEGFSARLLDAAVGATLRLGPGGVLRLGGGLLAGFLHIASPPNVSPETEDRATPGLFARAAGALPIGPIAVSLGPELRGYLKPKSVRVGDAEVLALPALSLGGSLEAEARF